MAKNLSENHGFKVTGGSVSVSGNDQRTTDHWTIQETWSNQVVQPTP